MRRNIESPTYPPVQLCPICGEPGKLVGLKHSLALDAQCTDPKCGFFYTTTARRAILAALTENFDRRRPAE